MDKRQPSLKGETRALNTGCGRIYITINKDEDGLPIELFARLGKAGGCASAQTEASGRLVSGWLRDGCKADGNPDYEEVHMAKLNDIIHMLKGISCNESHNSDGIFSCPHAIAIALEIIKENVIKGEGKEG